MKHGNLLTVLIVIGLVAGALWGEFFLYNPEQPITDGHWTYTVGNIILIRPLMLMIIPLIFVSVVCGVTSIGDPSKLGLVGGTTLLYYFTTMLIAVTLGAFLVSQFQPGALDEESRALLQATSVDQYEAVRGRIEEQEAEGKTTLAGAFLNIVKQIIPTNVIDEMAQGRTLGTIASALLFGLALALGREKTKPAVDFFNAMFNAIMRIVLWIVWLTPIGVFFLIAWTVGKIGLDGLLGPLLKYVGTVLAGLSIHALIVLPIILLLFARVNPFRFMWQMRRALMTAFGTDSSSATLPVTIECAEGEGKCSKRSANFVLPLGSTINMDGTALYEAVAVVFLFQLWGIELSMTELLIVVITATLAAIGAAGIPSAGIVVMVIVVDAVNQSLAGTGTEPLPREAIGVIIAIDRIVDMCRTTVNVWGDAVGAKIITRIAPDPPESENKIEAPVPA